MERLSVYLPRDRFLSLARGDDTLPDRCRGAALFADISGFTQLAEALASSLGPMRGPEELTRQLNLVYAAVISELDLYRGSVISFSGDAVTCWFENDDGRRAIASGLAMQAAMAQFASVRLPNGGTAELTVRIGIATGPARRFLVGDPSIQVIDTMAGTTLVSMAAAQHMARKREVVIAELTATALAGRIEIGEWRTDVATDLRFAVVVRLAATVGKNPWPTESTSAARESRLREWLLPPVYARLKTQLGEFLAEMRPAVALFLKFHGLDYDTDDDAGGKLDRFVRWVQKTLAQYEGFLIDITIGDKGSYLYCAFGAPVVHENDVWRALTVALVLRSPPADLGYIHSIQIGISQGTMRAGAYGGTTRRTYGVLGDDVNLAARLMEHAIPGHVLASGRIRRAADDSFVWEALPPIPVKGKAEPVPAYSLVGTHARRAVRLQEPTYALPMVGRNAELAIIGNKLDLALGGRSQIIGVTGEAGIGKSRIVAEAIRLANQKQFTGYGGQCQSYGTNTSYLVWWSIWQGFFDLDEHRSTEEQVRTLEAGLARINPDLVARLPLLSAVTKLPIPDNEITRSFDAKLRKSSLESLLMDCLRARARQSPLFVVLEDCHWIDPVSRELLETTARATVDLPVVLLLAYRPPVVDQERPLSIAFLPVANEIPLASFTDEESRQLMNLKIEKLFGAATAIPRSLADRFFALAEGNPFYLEELLNYLQDRGIALDDVQALEHLELPTSLRSLILSRIDQLTEHQKITLKVASVIGRIFRAAMLWGAYPQLGDSTEVKSDLEVLHQMDVTALDTPEPELIYLFKHIVTQEVAYGTLSFVTRAMLHRQIARFIERTFSRDLGQYLDLLAYHFDRSDDEVKKREYLLKAGEAAQSHYANAAAIDYYQRLLALLDESGQVGVMLKLGQVLELVGKWREAGDLYARALAVTDNRGDRHARARCQTATGELLRKQARYSDASTWLEQARIGFAELGDEDGVAQILHFTGNLSAQQGDPVRAKAMYLESLTIRRKLNDKPRIGSLLSNLGILAHQYTGEFTEARKLHEEGVGIRRELGDRWAIANSLNNLGVLLHDQGNLVGARGLLEESVALNRQVGDRWAIANSLSSLADVTLDQRDFATTRRLLEESLAINRDLDEHRAIAFLLEYFAKLAAIQADLERALRLMGAASALREAIGAPLSPAEITQQKQLLDSACESLDRETQDHLIAAGRNLKMEEAVGYAISAK